MKLVFENGDRANITILERNQQDHENYYKTHGCYTTNKYKALVTFVNKFNNIAMYDLPIDEACRINLIPSKINQEHVLEYLSKKPLLIHIEKQQSDTKYTLAGTELFKQYSSADELSTDICNQANSAWQPE